MGGAEECPHALLVPSSGQGHVNGGMLLARSLAALGFKVTFIYFSSYYAKLKAKKRLVLPYSSHPGEGQDPSSPGGGGGGGGAGGANASSHPPTTTTINNNGSHSNGVIEIHVLNDGFEPGDMDKHFHVTPAMKENLFNLILELREQDMPPTCLISDTFVPWTVHVAERAGIPRIDYWTSNAMSYLLISTSPALFSQGIFPEKGSPTKWKRETPLMLDHIPGLPPFSSELYPTDIRFSDVSSPLVSFSSQISSCTKYGERILIHTMSELEPDAFQALIQVAGIPAYAIGPLLHYTEGTPASSQAKETSGVSKLNEQVDCISWLNMQADSSVLYVAFGSFASLSIEEIQELASGLEASGSPFLWVIREDSHGGAELPQVLPDGFLERTGANGMIIGWAPQVEVLAHKAVGGFLTHCGWNSTFESLWAGVPMLCCPRFAEQRSNSHYICNVWGVGLELERTETGGVERRYVELGVKGLMQEEEGFKAKGKAQEVMQLARKTCQQGGQSFSNLQKFYDDMKVLCSNPSSHNFSNFRPRKVTLFLWLTAHRGLAVGAWLAFGRHPASCPRCGHALESQRHCLWDCPQAQQVWLRALRMVFAGSPGELLVTWGAVAWATDSGPAMGYEDVPGSLSIQVSDRAMAVVPTPDFSSAVPQEEVGPRWDLISSMTAWHIWRARCREAIDSQATPPAEVIQALWVDIIHTLSGYWGKLQGDSDRMRDRRKAFLRTWHPGPFLAVRGEEVTWQYRPPVWLFSPPTCTSR